MHLTWKQRLELQPNLKDITNWPSINQNVLSRETCKGFNVNKRIVNSVLKGNSLKQTSARFGKSSARISQILNRCLSGDDSDFPPLTKALIPGTKLSSGARIKPLSNINNNSGCRGSFEAILKSFPIIKEKLDEIIIQFIKKKSNGQNVTAKYFHKEFLKLLLENNWSDSVYPFDQDRLGYETCRKYLNRKIVELSLPKRKSKRQILTLFTPKKPYQEIQIDSQILDINTHINMEFNGDLIPLRLSRVTLFLATDVATGCRLAYHLCLTKDPTQLDLLNLLEKIHIPWKEKDFKTPGLEYQAGACLPNSLGEYHRYAGIGLIRLDNALCHLSNMARDYICNILSATLNLGLPVQPKGRNYIEHAFKLLNENIHRFPSTTGSHPKDPKKETKINSKKMPAITINALAEVLDTLITGHNVTNQENLGSLSPIELMQVKSNEYFPISFSLLNYTKNPFLRQKVVSVKHLIHEYRSPHINFMDLRYTGIDLNNPELINTKIIIEYDSRDIRNLTAMKTNGDHIGQLCAPKSWQAFPFSITTKKRIYKLTNEKRMRSTDLLSGYFRYLLKNKEQNKNVTEILRVYEEYTSGSLRLDDGYEMDSRIEYTSHERINDNSAVIPDWTPELIQKRNLNV